MDTSTDEQFERQRQLELLRMQKSLTRIEMSRNEAQSSMDPPPGEIEIPHRRGGGAHEERAAQQLQRHDEEYGDGDDASYEEAETFGLTSAGRLALASASKRMEPPGPSFIWNTLQKVAPPDFTPTRKPQLSWEVLLVILCINLVAFVVFVTLFVEQYNSSTTETLILRNADQAGDLTEDCAALRQVDRQAFKNVLANGLEACQWFADNSNVFGGIDVVVDTPLGAVLNASGTSWILRESNAFFVENSQTLHQNGLVYWTEPMWVFGQFWRGSNPAVYMQHDVDLTKSKTSGDQPQPFKITFLNATLKDNLPVPITYIDMKCRVKESVKQSLYFPAVCFRTLTHQATPALDTALTFTLSILSAGYFLAKQALFWS